MPASFRVRSRLRLNSEESMPMKRSGRSPSRLRVNPLRMARISRKWNRASV
jgi:hypothetical protein